MILIYIVINSFAKGKSTPDSIMFHRSLAFFIFLSRFFFLFVACEPIWEM